jgi:CRISPR-associated protein Csd1
MILQALNSYYERNEELPRQGWIRRGVDYVVVLDKDGTCIAINLIGTANKGKVTPQEMLLPSIGKQAMKHTNSGADANFLWDNASFVFGRGNKGDKKLAAFIEALTRWSGNSSDEGVAAVMRFCTALQQDSELALQLFKRFQVDVDFEKRDPVVIFRLLPDVDGVHTREAVRTAYETKLIEASGNAVVLSNCLVTGAINTPIAVNETVIKGVWGAQTSGANIISFNRRSFESYGKSDQGGKNAPVSVRASFAYTTALNHLLRKESPQRIQVGDASTVFWADQDSEFESLGADVFGEPSKDDPDRGTRAVHALLSAVQAGKFAEPDDNRFHILGLAPNAARISIRFYHCLPLPEMAKCIVQHFKDLELVPGSNDPQYPSLKRLLQTICMATSGQPYGDIDKAPPNLGGAIVDAIFAGPDTPYPALWLNAAVGRCRAEQAKKTQQGKSAPNVPYARAAVIKACLNRQIRRAAASAVLAFSSTPPEKEFLPMLDLDNTNPAYRLGRLFATLERIQEEASEGKLNSTIRDRYYGAASSTPASVFPTLLRLKVHHLGKLHPGRVINLEKLLGEIMSSFQPDSFPPRQLSLPDQGRFALGYYHQRQAFFSKPTDSNTPAKEGTPS